jgi:hypothetical protein
MATLDNQQISVGLLATLNNILDLQSAASPLTINRSYGMSSGTAANQADKIFTDTRTIAISGTDNLDISAGGLLDPLGVVFTVARLKLLYLFAYAANTNNVVVGGNAAGLVSLLVPASTSTLILRPGGSLLLFAPDATAYPVTATTADLIPLANSGAGTTVTYDVIMIGSSA